MNKIWGAGLDLLGRTYCKQAQSSTHDLLPCGDVAELLDKLLFDTGECQGCSEISNYLHEEHGWTPWYAEQVSMLYGVVDDMRTSCC